MVFLTPKEALSRITNGNGPYVLEIGFGNGSFLAYLAETRPKERLIGVDLANLAFQKAASRLKEKDVMLVKSEARFFLKHLVPPRSLKEVYILFPDPWPKRKKRRLVNPGFARLLSSRLMERGRVFIATDQRDYMEQMIESLSLYMRPLKWQLPTKTKYQMKWESMGINCESMGFENTNPESYPFIPAVAKIDEPSAWGLAPGILRQDPLVKVEEIYTGKGKKLVKLIFSEEGFSHRFFLLEEKGRIRSLNTWGEAFPASLVEVIKKAGGRI